MEQYEKRREELAKRLVKANAAKEFTKTDQGKLAIDMNNERVSYLMNLAFAKEPLPYEKYLSIHGAVRELQVFSSLLHAKEADLESVVSEMKIVDEQIKAVKQANGQETV